MANKILAGYNRFCALLRKTSLKIHTKYLCIILGLLFVATLVPLVVVGRYNYPIQDDFAFSAATRHAFVDTGSLWQVLKAAAGVSAQFYEAWQGSFTACFLFALQPGIFGTSWYGLTTVIMLASLITGTFALVWAVFTRLLKTDRWTAALVAFVLLFLSVQQVPNANQAFYWYNGAVYYTFFHGLSLLMVALLVGYCTAKRKGAGHVALAAATLLAVIVGGGNYVTALLSVLLLLFIEVVLFTGKNKHRWGALVPLLALCVAFFISVVAPGNANRQRGQLPQLGLLRSMFNSFRSLVTYSNEWAYLVIFLGFAFLVPFFWRVAGQSGLMFRLPVLVTAGSLCFLAAGMFPHIYATSLPGPDRLTDIVFFTMLLVVAANLLYWLGWLRRKLENACAEKEGQPRLGARVELYCKQHAVAVLAALVLCAAVFFVSPGRLNKLYTFASALSSMRNGEVATFAAEMDSRYALAEASPGQDVVVPPITAAPELLAYSEIYSDPTLWANEIFADYFRLNSIRELPVPQKEGVLP